MVPNDTYSQDGSTQLDTICGNHVTHLVYELWEQCGSDNPQIRVPIQAGLKDHASTERRLQVYRHGFGMWATS